MGHPLRPLTFSEILDELRLPVPTPARPVGNNHDWLYSVSSAESEGSQGSQSAQAAPRVFAYGDVGEPLSAKMSEEERVVLELSLDSATSLADLKRIRRAFALRNHPDLFKSGGHAEATARMKIANMLIDRKRREIEARC